MNDGAVYGVGMAVVAQGGTGWMIFDRSIIDSVQDVREFHDLGFYESAPTIRELAGKIGVNPENLAATIERYVGFVKAGKDADFNRSRLNMTFDEPPFYACKMTAHVQGTFGGIETDLDTRVLGTGGAAVPGLYAAGEGASVGTWGANPAAANIVFGTVAGKNAAAYAK
jgi:fumarate reductase flavoprotein subunit